MVTIPRAARSQCLSRLRAMATWSSAAAEPSEAEPIELENVVRRADQRPFTLYLLESPQQELAEATRLLDLYDHRFDDPLARGRDRRAGLRVQLAGHPIDNRGGLRHWAARTGPRTFAMFLFSRRDVRIDGRVADRGQVHVRAIAGVGKQLRGRVARLLFDGGDHRHQLLLVIRLLCDRVADDQLQFVDRDLHVVGLDESVGT